MEYTFHRSLGRLTQQVSKDLGRVLEQKFIASGYTINSSEWSVISFLNDKDRSSQKEIGKFLGENKVMIKRIIDNLEKGKYLKRKQSKYDRRFNKIELTKKGKNLYSELKPFAEETLKEAYSGLEDKEIANCLDTLNKIANKLDNL